MKRLKVLLRYGLLGATAGVLMVQFGKRGDTNISASLFDQVATARWPWVGAAIGWVLFSLYWEIAAKNAAESKSAEARSPRGINELLTNAALLRRPATLTWWTLT